MKYNPAITPPPASEPAVGPGTARFVPGYVLAGRYRMIAKLGQSGMGEVWRADDLLLETPVALKLIYASEPEGRKRILDEVRLARQMTHPAICRVFDVGESEGEVFYSMELVHGEDLSTLIRRLGRVPAEKVADIGQQLCEGLAAAHAQGILHRDLKPANVLIDEDGLVRITDFGIAVTRGGPGQPAIGTPGYIAPEQLASGAQVSERTDIFGIGLILYELLVGRPAFDARSGHRRLPPAPSALVADVDPRLERAILKAIARDPRDRPASVLELSNLITSAARHHSRVGLWLAGAGAVAVIAALAVGASFFIRPTSRALTEQDTIILADFLNTSGDPVFDGALKVALAVALEQSPFLKVFPDERIRETLRLMQRRPDEPITRTVAREIAQRDQLKALVAGSIASLGSHYVVALEAINADTGEVLAREQIEAPAKEQVLVSLGAATSRLREKLGESLALIEQFDVPLAQATTPSLEALHAYSLALNQGRMEPRPEAIPNLLRAIELDPNFAMAQALLSGVYANTGRFAEAPVYSRRAFELRDRVSERERYLISWRYHVDAEQAWDKALELGLSWTRTYPREAFAFNALGIASAAFGQHDQAVSAFEKAMELDARFVPPRRNLAGSLIALNRFDRAGAVVTESIARGGNTTGLRGMAYLLGFVRGDSTAMQREADEVRRTPQAMWTSTWEARASAFAGRIQAAHELFQRASKMAVAERFRELAAQWTAEDAESHAIAGQCDLARAEAETGLGLSRDNFTLERAARVLAFCGATGDAARLAQELLTRYPAATLTTRMHVPVIRAAAALRQRDFGRVLALLEPVKPYDHAPAGEFWPMYLRAEAHLGLKDAPAANAQFQAIIDRRGEALTSPLYVLAHLGIARAAALQTMRRDAIAAYEAFEKLWGGADARLPLLEQTRRERTLLQ